MYRRRRPGREKIVFSFDSFLDVVANVNGIIIRLILVAWVGARAYHASMNDPGSEPVAEMASVAALPPPRVEDDPLTPELAEQRRALDETRALLLSKLEAAKKTDAAIEALRVDFAAAVGRKQKLEGNDLAKAAADQKLAASTVALSLEQIQRRGAMARAQLAQLEAQPGPRKALRYHTPVSRTVTTDEIFFECKEGRVTYLDLNGFLKEIEFNLRDKEDQLRTQFSVEATTQPIGPFQVRYTIERRRAAGEAFGADRPQDRVYFGYGLGKFTVEPIATPRGEDVTQAMRATSEFRQTVDAVDSQTVVTFWVYPDSFALFRTLRDYLYERGIEVAGRPLPPGEPIGGSPRGSRSRGQ